MVKVRGMVVTLLIALSVTILEPVDTTKSDTKTVAVTQTTVSKKMFYTVKLPEKQYYNVPLSHSLQDYIHDLCVDYGVNETLVYGLIKTESNFSSSKISSTGDWGLCQINVINFDSLQKKLGKGDFLDPFYNVKCGIYMLSQLQKKYSNTDEVLIAYNQGEGSANQLISRGIGLTNYAIKVKENMSVIKKVGDSDRKSEGSRRVSSRMVENSRKPNMYLH